MFDQETVLEYLNSPEGITRIIVAIILVGDSFGVGYKCGNEKN